MDSLPATGILFGLEAQGHLQTVEQMLADGKSWADIGSAIGWDGDTACKFYCMHLGRYGRELLRQLQHLREHARRAFEAPTSGSMVESVCPICGTLVHIEHNSRTGARTDGRRPFHPGSPHAANATQFRCDGCGEVIQDTVPGTAFDRELAKRRGNRVGRIEVSLG